MSTGALQADATLLATAVTRAFQSAHRLAFAQVSPDLMLTQLSPNFLSLVNRPGGQPEGTALTGLLWEFVGLENELEKIMTGELPHFRLEHVQSVETDGSTGYRTFYVTPLDECEPGRGLLLLVEDVSAAGHLQQQLVQERNELRLARRELAQLNGDLQRLNRLKSLFLSMAAHDLRTPLTSIRGYSTLLVKDARLPDQYRKPLRTIAVQADKLNRLISDLLDLDQIEQGRLAIKPERCDLGEIVREVVEAIEGYARDQGKEIAMELPDSLLHLQADSAAIWRVLHNLVGNAVKYTESGGSIRVSAEQTAAETIIEVADNGLGMSDEEMSRLFQLYYRTGQAVDSKVAGTGVGLFIVKTLVEAHGGSIEVRSRQDVGSTFTVRLPTGV